MNAKIELHDHLCGNSKSFHDVICIIIRVSGFKRALTLVKNWTDEELESFLSEMDFEYDSINGSQNLWGRIWYKDSSWSERSEFDGSEWWDYRSLPKIPKELILLDRERDIKLGELGI